MKEGCGCCGHPACCTSTRSTRTCGPTGRGRARHIADGRGRFRLRCGCCLIGRSIGCIPGTDAIEPFLVLPPPPASRRTRSRSDDSHLGRRQRRHARADGPGDRGAGADRDGPVGRAAWPPRDDGLWVADIVAGELTHVDPESLRKRARRSRSPGASIRSWGVGRSDLWVLDKRAGTVTRVDTISRKVGRPTRVGRRSRRHGGRPRGRLGRRSRRLALSRGRGDARGAGVPDRRGGARRRRGRSARKRCGSTSGVRSIRPARGRGPR